MAVIATTTGVTTAYGAINLTRTTMTASDTLTWTQGAHQMLVMYNTTASPVTVTIGGTSPTPLTPDGYGSTLSTATPKSITVPASGLTFLDLDDIWAFITPTGGTVTITNGTGLTAALYTA